MSRNPEDPAAFGRMASFPRSRLFAGRTALELMPNLTRHCGGARLFVKRDDCTGLCFGGNKVRQLEFYLGRAIHENADTILITGAVQSNFVRLAAAAARKLGMDCHIQLEERVATKDPRYRNSGNVLIDKLLGATLHSYPDGEDEKGADRQLEAIAKELRDAGRRSYVIPLASGHPPLGALGYVLAANELLDQLRVNAVSVEEIFVASGSGATHAGLLFGLRALGSAVKVTGVCVRRDAGSQRTRIHETCYGIAALLEIESPVTDEDIVLTDDFLHPGYGRTNDETSKAIVLGARTEGLILDPVYTGKAMAAAIQQVGSADAGATFVFIHTGGIPAIFAYQDVIEDAIHGSATIHASPSQNGDCRNRNTKK